MSTIGLKLLPQTSKTGQSELWAISENGAQEQWSMSDIGPSMQHKTSASLQLMSSIEWASLETKFLMKSTTYTTVSRTGAKVQSPRLKVKQKSLLITSWSSMITLRFLVKSLWNSTNRQRVPSTRKKLSSKPLLMLFLLIALSLELISSLSSTSSMIWL